MESALHTRARVLAGHRIELVAPELEGQEVKVLVVASPAKGRRSFLGLLEQISPPGLFPTPEAVDRFLALERSSWER